jgi:hypothetical protein
MSSRALSPLRNGLDWSRRALGRHWANLAFVLLSCALFAWVATDAFTIRRVTLSQGADYWEHSATLRALIDDTWHPKNPHLSSAASSPRFVPSFILSALLAKAFGLDALGAMGIASCLHMLLLFTGIYAFFRVYFRDARAPLYAVIVMFGSWYDAWSFSNVYQLKVFFSVVSYPSTAALGLSLFGFTTTLRALREPTRVRWLLWTTVLLAVLMITHPLTAMMGFAGAGLLAATEREVPFAVRAKVAGAIALGGLLSLAWPYFSVRSVLTGGSHAEVSAIAQGVTGDGELEPPGKLHMFYREKGLTRTLGAALGGFPILLFLMARRRHWFISLGALSMLLPFVVNAYVPLPLGHRFILLAVFFLQAALVWLLLKLSSGAPEAWSFVTSGWRRWVSGLLIASFLLTLSWWNVDAAAGSGAYAERRMHAGESINVRYSRRLAELAGAHAVVITDAKSGWPVPTFGPKVLTLWHGNPLVPDEGERNEAVASFFHPAAPPAERQEILERYRVTHVLTRGTNARRVEPFLSSIRARRQALPGGYSLYTLPVAEHPR